MRQTHRQNHHHHHNHHGHNLKTEHLVPRTCVWLQGSRLKMSTGVVLSVGAFKKSSHLTAWRTGHFLIVSFLASTDDTHFTTADWNQEYSCATSLEGRQSAWLNHFLTQVMSPRLVSTPAVSTRRSITLRAEAASTSRTTSPPQSQPPRPSKVFISKRQPAGRSQHVQHVRETHGLAPTGGPALGN